MFDVAIASAGSEDVCVSVCMACLYTLLLLSLCVSVSALCSPRQVRALVAFVRMSVSLYYVYVACLCMCVCACICAMAAAAGAGAGGVRQVCMTVSALCSPRQVRALVAFVRKRDRRVAAQQRRLQERAAENARRAEQRRQEQRQQRLQQMADYTEAEWSRADQHEQQLKVRPAAGAHCPDALMDRGGVQLRNGRVLPDRFRWTRFLGMHFQA